MYGLFDYKQLYKFSFRFKKKVISFWKFQLQAVSELNKRMAKIEESKVGETNSQLEIIKMERDSLKSTSSSLAEQINLLRVESKQIQV